MPVQPLFGIASKDNGFTFPIEIYAAGAGYLEDTIAGPTRYHGEVFADEDAARRAADIVNAALGRGPAWPEASAPKAIDGDDTSPREAPPIVIAGPGLSPPAHIESPALVGHRAHRKRGHNP